MEKPHFAANGAVSLSGCARLLTDGEVLSILLLLTIKYRMSQNHEAARRDSAVSSQGKEKIT